MSPVGIGADGVAGTTPDSRLHTGSVSGRSGDTASSTASVQPPTPALVYDDVG